MFLKFICGLVLVSDDAVSLGVKYPADNDEEEEGVEEHNAEDGEMEEKENSCERFSRTDEASSSLTNSRVENVIPGSFRRFTTVPREKRVEGSNDSGQKERESESNKGRNSHARVVRVDGWGVVPGEGPHEVQSKSKYPKYGRAHG